MNKLTENINLESHANKLGVLKAFKIRDYYSSTDKIKEYQNDL